LLIAVAQRLFALSERLVTIAERLISIAQALGDVRGFLRRGPAAVRSHSFLLPPTSAATRPRSFVE
jgi:hypothetical protein